MRPIHTLLICILCLTPMTFQSPEASTPLAFTCPITQQVEKRPDPSIDPFDDDAWLFYENGLWVTIPEDGLIELTPDDTIAFGKLEGWRSTPVTWLREEGIKGFIEVTGHRMDEESNLHPRTPLSPQRQYVRIGTVTTGIAFPGTGCWQVTGSAGDHSVTFTVHVRFIDAPTATPHL